MLTTPQIALLSTTLLLMAGSGAAWLRGRHALALGLLMGAAFALRLCMACLDPFLHDWDERYHALVAKHLATNPLEPLLRSQAYLSYDYRNWGGNVVWLHKQPLFLWQIALSLRLFGINEVALRLPSALLTTLLLYPVYRISLRLFADRDAAYLAAVLVAFASIQLELVSGYMGMDHNDTAFLVYVTASVWVYYEYRAGTRHRMAWLVAIGCFAGAAVLCKWLTGLLVYAGWGVALLLDPTRRRQMGEYLRLMASALVAGLVFLPWQLYTAWRFPQESAYERTYNTRHFFEQIEGHGGTWSYHFEGLPILYADGVLALVLLGVLWTLWRGPRPVEILVMVVVTYLFFILAATKLLMYGYVVSPLLLVLAAVPLAAAVRWVRAHTTGWVASGILAGGLLMVVWLDAQPLGIYQRHFQEGNYPNMTAVNRAKHIANTAIYRKLDADVPPGYLIFNAPDGEEIAAMFYSDRPVYAWWPTEPELAVLRQRGLRVALFPDRPDRTTPPYLHQPAGTIVLWGYAE